MQCLPQLITSFTYSNLTEEYNIWSPTTTYILETNNAALTNASMVIYGSYIYRSLTNGNLNYNPEEYLNIKWVRYGIANKYAMLDLSSQSSSTNLTGDLIVEFKQNRIDDIVLGNYKAAGFLIEVLDPTLVTVLWSYNVPSPLNLNVTDYFTYIYEPYNYSDVTSINIHLPVIGDTVRVTFYGTALLGGGASCGFLTGGNAIDMGQTLWGVKFGFHSYALKSTDDFGKLTITKRAIQDMVDFETIIPSTILESTKRNIRNVYNEIMVFIVDESETSDYENIIVLGTVESVNVVLKNATQSTLTWSILEAI